MAKLHIPKNRFVAEGLAKKDREGRLKTRQLVFRILLVVIVLGILVFLGFRVDSSVKSLANLKFSSKTVGEFLPEDRNPKILEADISTLFIGEIDESKGKKELVNFTVLRFDNYRSSLLTISFPSEIHFRPFRYFRSIQSDIELDTVKIKTLPVVGDLSSPAAPYAYTFYEIEELLALKLDGYIFVKKSDVQALSGFSSGDLLQRSDLTFAERWVKYLEGLSLLRIWAGKEAISKVESNLASSQVYNLSVKMKNVADTDKTYLEVDSSKLLDIVDSKGEYAKLIPVSVVDELLEEYTVDIRIDREQARVEIFNGSEVDGLGGRYERWVKHMGVDVIRVENAPGTWVKRPKTTIYVTSKEEFPLTLGRVQSLWKDPLVVEGRPDFLTTGDIIIILGMDFYRD